MVPMLPWMNCLGNAASMKYRRHCIWHATNTSIPGQPMAEIAFNASVFACLIRCCATEGRYSQVGKDRQGNWRQSRLKRFAIGYAKRRLLRFLSPAICCVCRQLRRTVAPTGIQGCGRPAKMTGEQRLHRHRHYVQTAVRREENTLRYGCRHRRNQMALSATTATTAVAERDF
jgi:hypothetical protein